MDFYSRCLRSDLQFLCFFNLLVSHKPEQPMMELAPAIGSRVQAFYFKDISTCEKQMLMTAPQTTRLLYHLSHTYRMHLNVLELLTASRASMLCKSVHFSCATTSLLTNEQRTRVRLQYVKTN